jgi:N-acetyl-gamma-glutamyl-phosphate reductase
MIRAGILGAAGYTGGELLRLLVHHPAAEVVFAQSRSQAGKPVAAVHPDLADDTALVFCAEPDAAADVYFLCLPHGEARTWLSAQPFDRDVRIIDLSHDHRLGGAWQDEPFVYGLPELDRAAIAQARLVANPGCFATALQLALLPLAAAGQLGAVYATGITGATGAGQGLSSTSHFPWRHANIAAYKTLQHQHLGEVLATLGRFGGAPALHFVPWRGDFARGIYVSCTLPCSLTAGAALELYEDYYRTHPFTVVSAAPIDLKRAVNTNKAWIQPEVVDGHLVVHAAIDNLLKGASGQAVQNMNLMFGLEETAGLMLKASVF